MMQAPHSHHFKRFLWALAAWTLTGSAQGEETIQVLPGDFTLHGTTARQHIVVEKVIDGTSSGQVRDGLVLKSSNEKVFQVKDGVATPVGNGEAMLTADAEGKSASVKVTVTAADQPFRWSFRNHVQSVLVKAGCNSGACHGAAAGKKGFRLSLRGYDAEGDYNVLTRQARGRRILTHDPGRSLILTKPTAAIQHGGGKRFDVGSLDYNVIAEWIAAGAEGPKPDDPRVTKLQILPAQVVLKKDDRQQLIVLAHFSDGHVEDVTPWAKYTSANGEVTNIEQNGVVTTVGQGEGGITAWYANHLVVATVTVPYAQNVAEETYVNAPKHNFIDELTLEKLKSLNLPPSPPCTDAEFLRRAFLDTVGVLPTTEEARQFLSDPAPEKRSRLIDSLLSRPEYVDYWTYKFCDLLLVRSEGLAPPAMWSYYHWVRNHVAANTPWDEIARDLVTAQGSTLENGATNFYLLHQDPRELTETISQAFLGMSINCARCHNHPLEKWTNDQYYGMANLVGRVRIKDLKGEGNFMVFASSSGDILQPLTGKPRDPQPLDGEAIPLDAPGDRRVHLAQWLTSPENPYFTRAITNRIWANFFGVGLVESVDDLRFTNPASNPKLLESLSKHLSENHFDLKRLMKTILESATYQRSSVPVPGNEADKRFYSRYYPKRLMAEVLIDAVSTVTEVPNDFPGYPKGWRAIQLPDTQVASYFLQKFGRPDRVITCECERTNEPNMVQALHIANGDSINEKLAAKENRISRLLAQKQPVEALLDELYLASLSRFATPTEKEKFLAVLGEDPKADPRQEFEDVAWSILSSKEFLFNH
ncbi:MAG: DUF1553 domain-containing protein [Planctomycetota bacterium]